MIRAFMVGTGAGVRRQFGWQNWKNRAIRVVTVELSILAALDGPPAGWQQWIAVLGGFFGAIWTSEERAAAELPPKP